jgi:hypothetical protein
MKRTDEFETFLVSLASYENLKEGLEKEISKKYSFSTELRKAYLLFLSGEEATKAFSKLIERKGEEGEAFLLIAHSLETGARIQKALLRIAEQISTKKKLEIELERKLGMLKFTTIISSSFIFPVFCSIVIHSFSLLSNVETFLKFIAIFYLFISSLIDGVFQNQKFLPIISIVVFLLSSFILKVVL